MKEGDSSTDEALWTMVRAMKVRTMVIFEAGRPYMARFRLQDPVDALPASVRPPFRTYLHYLFASDDLGFFHNHPWTESQSLILTGQYAEERILPDGTISQTLFQAGETNVIRRGDVHRIDILEPGMWTLFTAGAQHGESWGFYRRGDAEFIPWRDRNRGVKGEEEGLRMTSDDHRLLEWRDKARRDSA